MSYRSGPLLPQKPAVYARQAADGAGASMQELLGSLSIDDYPYEAQSPREAQTYANRNTSAHKHTLPPAPLEYHRGSLPPQQALRIRQHSPELRDTEARSRRSTVAGQLPSVPAQDNHASRETQRMNETSPWAATSVMKPGYKRPVRKPVDTSEPARSYYSPDDLDRLLELPRRSAAPQREVLQQEHAMYTGHPASPVPMPSEMYQEYRVVPTRIDTHTPNTIDQQPHSYEAFTAPDRVRYMNAPPESASQYARFPGHDEPLTLPTASFSGPRHDPMQQYVSLPSPPVRQNSTPLTRSRAPSPMFEEQFTQHQSFHRSNPDMTRTDFAPPPRQNSVPLRSLSALSNHSQRSPDRQYRHPISELEDAYGGRIPSPDRSTQFPDIAEGTDRGDRDSESMPPQTQVRRGRPKGESVMESDLPAMPPLFAQQEERHPSPSLPPSSIGQAYLPPRSPTTKPSTSPKIHAKKRNSFVKEPDSLQSIKGLPIRPIRCPAPCLEERYHPSSFAKTNKFKIKVIPAESTFVAGGEIFGHIDISSDEGFRAALGSTQVLVGEIGVEVIGYEELQHVDSGHNPRAFTFLFSRKIFQRQTDPHPDRSSSFELTSAVLNDPPADQDGYRTASKGTTSFPFAFPLPVDCASSADVGVARIRYVVTGYAMVKLQGSLEVIATSQQVRVVEAWDVGNPVYEEPVEATHGIDVANYETIYATAKIDRNLFIEGQTLSGTIKVVNYAPKKVREVKFLLVNKITFFGDKRSEQKDLNPADDFDLEETVAGFAEQHLIVKGCEELWKFNIQIPADRCISVRNSALFEVSQFVQIKISTGPLQRSTKLSTTPICVASPLSMIDGMEKSAPTSASMKWSNLPSLYRSQTYVQGQAGAPEKGRLEVSDLMVYIGAHERVMLLTQT